MKSKSLGLALLTIGLALIVVAVGCSNKKLPKHTVARDDVTDAPYGAIVTMSLVVEEEVTEESLRTLLEETFAKTKKRKGFDFHPHPTVIRMWVFASQKKYEWSQEGGGRWIGMLLWDKDKNEEPNIQIDEEELAKGINPPPQEKFGLSEQERIEIWKETVRIEDRATEEAVAGGTMTQAKAKKCKILEDKYLKELAEQHGLTPEQIEEIKEEALEEGWPYPKPE